MFVFLQDDFHTLLPRLKYCGSHFSYHLSSLYIQACLSFHWQFAYYRNNALVLYLVNCCLSFMWTPHFTSAGSPSYEHPILLLLEVLHINTWPAGSPLYEHITSIDSPSYEHPTLPLLPVFHVNTPLLLAVLHMNTSLNFCCNPSQENPTLLLLPFLLVNIPLYFCWQSFMWTFHFTSSGSPSEHPTYFCWQSLWIPYFTSADSLILTDLLTRPWWS